MGDALRGSPVRYRRAVEAVSQGDCGSLAEAHSPTGMTTPPCVIYTDCIGGSHFVPLPQFVGRRLRAISRAKRILAHLEQQQWTTR